jgi:uncharacterized SAM-binding protein YcdF (DUF218 family)
MTSRRLAQGFGIALLVAVLGFSLGFAWFIHLVDEPLLAPPQADGIVAFTGGADRVETALRLLSQGRAGKLLLSGIGGGAELSELAHLAGVDPIPLATRVTIGRGATTTRGNAQETAAWASANDIHSLLVVTASYHMPRAMTELHRALPDTALYPLPVLIAGGAGRPAVPLRLIAEEYVKFLATRSGLTAVLPPREPPPAHGGHAG